MTDCTVILLICRVLISRPQFICFCFYFLFASRFPLVSCSRNSLPSEIRQLFPTFSKLRASKPGANPSQLPLILLFLFYFFYCLRFHGDIPVHQLEISVKGCCEVDKFPATKEYNRIKNNSPLNTFVDNQLSIVVSGFCFLKAITKFLSSDTTIIGSYI